MAAYGNRSRLVVVDTDVDAHAILHSCSESFRGVQIKRQTLAFRTIPAWRRTTTHYSRAPTRFACNFNLHENVILAKRTHFQKPTALHQSDSEAPAASPQSLLNRVFIIVVGSNTRSKLAQQRCCLFVTQTHANRHPPFNRTHRFALQDRELNLFCPSQIQRDIEFILVLVFFFLLFALFHVR